MIKLKPNVNIFFCSDTHYSHKNICRGVSSWGSTDDNGVFHVHEWSTRPYPDLVAMNAAIINNINDVVMEDDILIHLGDWSFSGKEKVEEFRNQINCKNIILIFGNHDHHIRKYYSHLFKHVSDYEELIIEGKGRFVLSHYPILSWNDMRTGTIMLHGHQHLKGDKRFGLGKRMDCGMCGNGLKPYHVDDILEIMKDIEVYDLTNLNDTKI